MIVHTDHKSCLTGDVSDFEEDRLRRDVRRFDAAALCACVAIILGFTFLVLLRTTDVFVIFKDSGTDLDMVGASPGTNETLVN